ncbi:uncharacterized protein BJ212DRAFT_1487091 [Suillus subaureus]|uniref:Uncharacterized protein n=1 Tax=Suillus subaureus TaxID=48587 RepID=A0A9P7DUE7_9AGAM|nr:uncharacterized protein BJ212DRAFT_1487091 [Suillus subaureus]KAG1803225.1 hypothetical protein BJ212DRAFT_1487091 [Suillus subaureus]
MAGPDDRFGFKPSSTDTQDSLEATQSIGHSSKKGVGESFKHDMREDRRLQDLDESNELENDADEQDRNGQPCEDEDGHWLTAGPLMMMKMCEATDTFDVLEHHQMKNGQHKAPSPTHLANTHPEQPPACLSVPHSKSPQHLPCSSAFHNLSPRQHSPTQSMISSSHKLPSSCKHSLSQSLHRHSAHPDPTPSPSQTPSPPPSSSQASSHSASPVQHTKSQHMSWQAFLQRAKVEMQLQAVLSYPLPVHQDAVLLAQEVLDAILWTYHMRKLKLNNAVAKLLKTGEYLWLLDSSEGKYTNFVSQVLKDAYLNFYYSNGKKALKLTDDFQHQIPVNGLILVAMVTKGVLSSVTIILALGVYDQ